MNKNDNIKFRIDSELKRAFKEACDKKDISMSKAIESMIKQMVLETKN